jgi:CheY-like chemotaxis protein
MPQRILLVEDDKNWQRILSDAITKTIPDCIVDVAPCVLSAVKLLTTEQYSGIVMDNQLPAIQMSRGYEKDLADVNQLDLPGVMENAGAVLIKAIRRGHFKRVDGSRLSILPGNVASPILFNSSAMDGQLAQMVNGLVSDTNDKDAKALVRFLNTFVLSLTKMYGREF